LVGNQQQNKTSICKWHELFNQARCVSKGKGLRKQPVSEGKFSSGFRLQSRKSTGEAAR